MTEQLEPQPADKVLEIGTGSGYQAAVLSGLVDQVYSIEIVEALGRKAAGTLRRLGYNNVHTKVGDGFQGWPEHAPFDKIIVTCSPESIPRPLVDQLAEGGRIVVPLGQRFQQTLCRLTKVDSQLKREPLRATFFVPMTGLAEQKRQIKPDRIYTDLVHGSFEETAEESDEPAGWFYVRQARVVGDPRAPAGEKCVVFSNSTAGRNAHAMQAFGVDGRTVRQLVVSLWVRGSQLQAGQTERQQPKAIVEFYDSNRAPVGHAGLGPWSGSFGWTRQTTRVRVPPTTRLAVLGIGLFGATGQVAVDDVQVTPPQ
jgi:protein-L-isoaspartate(D-aspartate) O-methyltransferase